MTNREDESDSGETRLAALLAVHLVSQVLDEAYVITNAATESGQPWRYLEMLKNIRSGQIANMEEENVYYCTSKEYIETKDNEISGVTNVVATSTPQKLPEAFGNIMNNTSFIGQGDEEFSSSETQNDMNSSTAMFINNLFDMSEVEQVIICDDSVIAESNQDSNYNDLLTEAMAKIMESYINNALSIVFDQDKVVSDCTESSNVKISPCNEQLGYSILTDTISTEVENIVEDIAFYLDKDIIETDQNVAGSSVTVTEITQNENSEKDLNKSDVARYENAFLTLNRDYDQYSEEDGEPVLQDPKGLIMQDIELEVTQAPDDNNTETHEIKEIEELKTKELKSVSAISAAASSHKSSLVKRCRTQGARLLACLRGWWRRKTPGKRKEARVPGSMRGICPLSPDARRRATSLLDQSRLGSYVESVPHVVWKFNTVSEALVNSSRWKNYTFDANNDECAKYL
ncbi:unnamed protein product [Chilo suppressalis]|uniref:Uncharacterized protein n=1 Tax=Chilo suppressalis TaxID=168631 RepID=A0ABN8L510_CHISP|nr:unnamed protein product [Chilo suppressalis]